MINLFKTKCNKKMALTCSAVFNNKLEVNEGMLVENIVAQMLRAAGHKLYFSATVHGHRQKTVWRLTS